jgi:hypothetical protein
MEPSAAEKELCFGALRFVELCTHRECGGDNKFNSALCMIASVVSDETLGSCFLHRRHLLDAFSSTPPARLEALASRFLLDVVVGERWNPPLKFYLSLGEFIVETAENFLDMAIGNNLKSDEWRAHLVETTWKRFNEKIALLEVALSSVRLVDLGEKTKKRPREEEGHDEMAKTPTGTTDDDSVMEVVSPPLSPPKRPRTPAAQM